MSNSSNEEKDNVCIAWHESTKVLDVVWFRIFTWNLRREFIVNSSEIVVLSTLFNINAFYIVLFSMIEVYFIL